MRRRARSGVESMTIRIEGCKYDESAARHALLLLMRIAPTLRFSILPDGCSGTVAATMFWD